MNGSFRSTYMDLQVIGRATSMEGDRWRWEAAVANAIGCRCLLAVHHGGAGTLGAALCAGIPSVVFWMIADQRFWATRVLELGVGHSRVCSMLQLSAHVLEEQIIAALQDTVQGKARALGTKLRAERGTLRGCVVPSWLSLHLSLLMAALRIVSHVALSRWWQASRRWRRS